jgi:hypothetical protein
MKTMKQWCYDDDCRLSSWQAWFCAATNCHQDYKPNFSEKKLLF